MRRVLKPTMALIVGLLSLFVLYLYFSINPATSYFMPKCMMKVLTGYDCPSCGIQRVVHALLHGRVYEAFMLNPFLFLIAPYLIALLYSTYSKSRLALAIKPVAQHYITVIIYLVIYFAWWVIRNTDWWLNIAVAE